MARLTFRQGIVRHQEDTSGNQEFLDVAGGYVTLVVSPDPTVIAFVHGTADYLFTESTTVTNAWGPFTPGIDRWLYWDLNLVTGVRTFGSTELEPLEQPNAPTSPFTGQMWFNTQTNMWFEFNGASWVEVVRVFSCKLDVGLVPRSASISAPDFKGTQVGLTGLRRVGSLVFDAAGSPIKTPDHKFFTTEHVFTSGVPTGASLRINNVLIPGQAQQPIAAYQVVEYSAFNKLVPASPFTQGEKVYGIVEEDAVTNQVINFVTEGLIFNTNWDWVALGAVVNDPVFINSTGEIQLNPVIPEQLPVGVVLDRQEILFAPRLFPQVTTTGGGGGATLYTELLDTPNDFTGAASNFVKVNSAGTALEHVVDPGYLTGVTWGIITGTLSSQTDLQTALDGKVSITGDTMDPGANITFNLGEVLGLPAIPSAPDAAASKAYVDSLGGAGDRIVDGDTDTWVAVDNNPTNDTDKITMRLGFDSLEYSVVGNDVFSFDIAGGLSIKTPTSIATASVPGVPVEILTGSGSLAGPGGDVSVIAGAGGDTDGVFNTGRGGNISINAGAGGAGDDYLGINDGDGGTVTITGGIGRNIGQYDGAVLILTADAPSGTNHHTGDIEIRTGEPDGTGDSGEIVIETQAHTGVAGSQSGDITIQTGNSYLGSGSIEILAGSAITQGEGGDIVITTGSTGDATSSGGDLAITADHGPNGGHCRISMHGAGGNFNYGNPMTISAGDASGNNADGGQVVVQSGSGDGTGVDGHLVLATAGTGDIVIGSRDSNGATVGLRFAAEPHYDSGASNLTEGKTDKYVKLQAPNSLTAGQNVTYTLPYPAPAVDGYILSSTTAGVMSWIAPPSGGGGDAIIDADGDTWVKVDNNTTSDTDKITMRLGALAPTHNVPGTNGDVLSFTNSIVTGLIVEAPSAITGQNVSGFPIKVTTGSGDDFQDGGDLTLETGFGGGGTDGRGDGGNITLRTGLGGEGDSYLGITTGKSGDILIETSGGDDYIGTDSGSGDIIIRTGEAVGNNLTRAGNIDIVSGEGVDTDPGDVNITSGNSSSGFTAGDIIIKPGEGVDDNTDGAVILGNQSAELRFICDNFPTEYIGFRAPTQVSLATTGDGVTTIWSLPEGEGTDGQAMLTDGAGILRWGDVGIPASTSECTVLVSDGAGDWTERAPLELPRLYDVAAQAFGAAPDNVKIFKFVSPQKFTLLDYGHQGHADTTGAAFTGSPFPDSTTLFDINLNGTKVGELGFHSSGASTSYFTTNVGSGWPNGNGNYMGSFVTVDVGDVIDIVSPTTPPASMEDVSLVLRGIVEPAAPCGTIGVIFADGKNIAADEFYSAGSESMTMTFTGSITHAEWSVVGYVSNSNWPPTGVGLNKIIPLGSNEFGFGGGDTATGPTCAFTVPGVGANTFNDSSEYVETGTLTTIDLGTFTGGTARYLLRCTVFGPGGIASDLAWVTPPAGP